MSSALHAPEYEYIKENAASLTIAGSATDYAIAVINLLKQPSDIQKMRSVCAQERENYTFDVMVSNFRDGILAALNQRNENA
jgi:hypothetical protein